MQLQPGIAVQKRMAIPPCEQVENQVVPHLGVNEGPAAGKPTVDGPFEMNKIVEFYLELAA